MNAIIYCRVSSDDQQDNNSLPTQREACLRYAMQHRMNVIGIFEDVMSGAVLDRPGLNAAREKIRTGEAKALIVYHTDRLVRGSAYDVVLRDELCNANAQLHTVTRGRVPLRNPVSKLFTSIETSFGSYEREQFMERSARSKIGKVSSGKVLGQGPYPLYGYRYVGFKRDRRLEVNEEEAVIVRRIYERCLTGLGCTAIAASLDADGVTPPAVKRVAEGHLPGGKPGKYGKWNASMVNRVLRNPAYRGEMVYDLARPDSETEDDAERVQITVSVPRIVSDEVWYAAQERLDCNRVFAQRNAKRFYLMRGRLTCACGYRLIGETSVKRWNGEEHCYSDYRCGGSRVASAKRCRTRVKVADVDAAVWRWICNIIGDEATLAKAIEDRLSELRASVADLEARRTKCQQIVTEAEARIARLIDLCVRGRIDEDELTAQRQIFDDKKRRANQELARLTAEIERTVAPDDVVKRALALARQIRPMLPATDDDLKAKIVDTLDITARLVHTETGLALDVTARLTGGQDFLIVSTPSSYHTRQQSGLPTSE